MSLKTYIDTQVQDFRKNGAANILFGLQNAPTYKLLPIFEAYESGSSASPTEITAVKIDTQLNEISRTVLATDLIIYKSGTAQYVVDPSKITSLNDGSIYYLEFKNGFNVFTTEAFLVKAMDVPLKWDLIIITFDSTLITFDQSNINI